MDHFFTFQQVEHMCSNFLIFLANRLQLKTNNNQSNSNHHRLRCIAAVIDDSPEWFILDLACAVVGICFVGFHTSWPKEDLDRAIHKIVKPDLILYHERDEKIIREIVSTRYASDEVNNNNISIHLLCFEELESSGVFSSSSSEVLKTFDSIPQRIMINFFSDSLENNHFDILLLPNGDEEEEKHQQQHQNHNHTTSHNSRRPFTLMFSSGTSGSLKAVEVSCDAWLQTNFKQQRYQLDPYSIVSFNALAHGLDRGLCWTAFFSAGRISFLPKDQNVLEKMKKDFVTTLLRENHDKQIDNLTTSSSCSSLPDFVIGSHLSNPSVLVASPDLWTSLKSFISSVFQLFCASSPTRIGQEEEEQQILKTAIIKTIFGSNIKQAATGGAPISSAVLEFFQKEVFSLIDANADVPSGLREKTKANKKQNDHGADDETAQFFDVYGATEAPGISTNNQIRGGLEIALVMADDNLVSSSSSCGVSVENKKNLDDQVRVLNFEGELLVRGSGVANRYHNDQAASESSFLQQDDGGGWYRTGDLARIEIVTTEKQFHQQNNNNSSTTIMMEGNEFFLTENISICSSAAKKVVTIHRLNKTTTATFSTKLFVLGRVHDLIELYVDHQSAWVPASKIEEAILNLNNEDRQEQQTEAEPQHVIIQQAAVFGDRMLPFLVAVVGVAETDSLKKFRSKSELEDHILKKMFLRKILFKETKNIPDYWIPKKVMVHVVSNSKSKNEGPTKLPTMKKWESGGRFRTQLGKLRRSVLENFLRNDLAEYFVA